MLKPSNPSPTFCTYTNTLSYPCSICNTQHADELDAALCYLDKVIQYPNIQDNNTENIQKLSVDNTSKDV